MLRPSRYRAASLLFAPLGGVAALASSPLSGPIRALVDQAQPVAEKYAPLRADPELFDPALVSDWLHPQFLALLEALRDGEEAEDLVSEESMQVYSFPLLSDDACERLANEVEAFLATGLPARRPNSMNRYGLIVNEIGLRPSLDALQSAVWPVARSLFPLEAEEFNNHHSFCVSYKPDEDRGLDMHTDDSDVTLNVCLGREFVASGLTFCGDMGAVNHRQASLQYQHRLGRAVMHLGRRRHGADDISEGHRLNLIMWNYNSGYRASTAYRSRSYYREKGAPSPECVSYTHDRDFEAVRGEARPEEKFAQTAWCPPPQAEYDGFEGKLGRYGNIDPMHRELPVN